MNVIGVLGTLFLSLSALPQVIQTIKQKHAVGVNSLMLWLWFLGVVFMFIYTFQYKDLALILNYIANMTFVGTMLYYKYFGKGNGPRL